VNLCNVNISQNKCEILVQNLLKERFQFVRCVEMPKATRVDTLNATFKLAGLEVGMLQVGQCIDDKVI
jgi:hypothetical protein